MKTKRLLKSAKTGFFKRYPLKNMLFISILMLSLAVALSFNVSASNLYNYVYNGSSWVPMLSTDNGQQKLWIQMKNCSYGRLHADSGGNVKVGI